jgi:hypothetical protein
MAEQFIVLHEVKTAYQHIPIKCGHDPGIKTDTGSHCTTQQRAALLVEQLKNTVFSKARTRPKMIWQA